MSAFSFPENTKIIILINTFLTNFQIFTPDVGDIHNDHPSIKIKNKYEHLQPKASAVNLRQSVHTSLG
jgi:hypothetical protein